MCDKIVDVLHEAFTRKHYFVQISQSKKKVRKKGRKEGRYYLIVRKKRGRLIGEAKQALHRKIFDVSGSVFNWYRENNKFLGEQKCYRNVLVIIFIIF